MCVHVCACVSVCVCAYVHIASRTVYQMKETWDYANIKERVDDATSVKEKGTKYFRVSSI